MNTKVRELVRRRAGFRCEYCRLTEEHAIVTPLQIEHIIARKHAGRSTPSNLAIACHHCNLFKSSDLAGLDPATGKLTPLFHPRRHTWTHHFRWEGIELVGRTAIGRTTVRVLNMNGDEQVRLREILRREGVFPW